MVSRLMLKNTTLKIVFLLGFLIIGLTSNGQELRNRFGDVYYSPNLYQTKYNSLEGTPYLNETFTPAKINDISETMLVRFDAFEDRVEIMVTKNQVVILEGSQPYTIELLDGSDKRYETKKYLDEKGNLKTSFFEVIAQKETYTIYLKEKMKFLKAEKAQGYEASKPAMFKKQKAAYYITDFKGQSDHLIKLPYKVKNFVAFFPDSPKSVRKFIKENKLKIDNADDLAQIFDFYFDSN